MTLIAIVRIDHPELALAHTIGSTSGTKITVVPESGTDPDTGQFFFHVEADDGDFEAFERALDDDDTVAEYVLVAEAGATRIYRIQHTSRTKLLTPKTTEVGGLMREAGSAGTGWRVRLQLPSREALADIWEFCEAEEISFELLQLYEQNGIDAGDGGRLTDAQREALVTAYERGYFEEPRGTTHEKLATELGISATAVGGRIRRGMTRLIEATLVEEEE
jgi:predicted DNA binding protein